MVFNKCAICERTSHWITYLVMEAAPLVSAADAPAAPRPLGEAIAWAAEYTNAHRPPHSTAGGTAASTGILTDVRLRKAAAADVGHIMRFIRELAEFEREPDAVKTDESTMLADGFGEQPAFWVMLAEVPSERVVAAPATAAAAAPTAAVAAAPPPPPPSYTPVAMAFCFQAYSTWEGRMLFLEDLYVTPAYRRRGISGLLFTALARAAWAARCCRVQFTVLKWNEAAIAAYERPPITARHLSDWALYRLTRDDIARLSGLGPY